MQEKGLKFDSIYSILWIVKRGMTKKLIVSLQTTVNILDSEILERLIYQQKYPKIMPK